MPSIDAFDLSALTEEQRSTITAAINRCTFDFTRCLPRLKREKARQRIPVNYADLSRYADAMPSEDDGAPHSHTHNDAEYHTIILRKRVLGLAWYSGAITLESSLTKEPKLAQEVFLAEAAHMVDFFVLTPEERKAIYDLFHGGGTPEHGHGWFEETGNNDYWSWVGESWMGAFIRAYSDIEPWDSGFMHRLNEGAAQAILPVLDPPPPPPPTPAPTPTPAPQPVPPTEPTEPSEPSEPIVPDEPPEPTPTEDWLYFATAKGKVFHDSHKRIKQGRVFLTREGAIAAGLRPCPTCRP